MKLDYSPPTADEFKFILDSWSSSFRKSPFAGVVPNNKWEFVSRLGMTEIMTRDSCVVTVATVPGVERGRVVGYSVSEPGILHWLYVKKDFRRLGIGSSLLTELQHNWNSNEKMHPRYTYRTMSAGRFLPIGWKWDVIPARVKV